MADENRIDILKEFLRTEEAAIPVYSRHIDDALFLSGLKEENRAKVKSILEKLRLDSLRHREILETIIAQLKK